MVDDEQPIIVGPGDTLIEEDNGKWRVKKSLQKDMNL